MTTCVTGLTTVRVDVSASQPPADYETEGVVRGSARARVPERGEQHRRFELRFDGPDHGNPFLDVDLVTDSRRRGTVVAVGGFYDGNGQYVVRLLPERTGEWFFRTRSNARSLDGISGTFVIEPGSAHGRVRVAEQFHFRHVDGSRYTPVGTTAYAWIHQPEPLRRATIDTLRESPFNKLRFCVFPKSYLYNSEEPEQYPFPRTENGAWDTTRFDVSFFQALDAHVDELADAGIQADLILFHPYDRWGFSNLGASADDRYVRYVVRRLAGHSNIWWSLANEFDLISSKTIDNWERLAAVVQREDHAHHLVSIHNGAELYDNSRPWITHASVQRLDLYRRSRIRTPGAHSGANRSCSTSSATKATSTRPGATSPRRNSCGAAGRSPCEADMVNTENL